MRFWLFLKSTNDINFFPGLLSRVFLAIQLTLPFSIDEWAKHIYRDIFPLAAQRRWD